LTGHRCRDLRLHQGALGGLGRDRHLVERRRRPALGPDIGCDEDEREREQQSGGSNPALLHHGVLLLNRTTKSSLFAQLRCSRMIFIGCALSDPSSPMADFSSSSRTTSLINGSSRTWP